MDHGAYPRCLARGCGAREFVGWAVPTSQCLIRFHEVQLTRMVSQWRRSPSAHESEHGFLNRGIARRVRVGAPKGTWSRLVESFARSVLINALVSIKCNPEVGRSLVR